MTRELLLPLERAQVARCGGSGRPPRRVWKGRFIGCLSGTPSDHRTTKNDNARLRRNGLNITSKGTYDGPA